MKDLMGNQLFEKTSVPKAYMTLALPVVLSMMVSLVVPIFTMMIAFGDIFGLGVSSAISRLFGEKRETDAKKTSAFCIWTSIAFGLCVTLPSADSL